MKSMCKVNVIQIWWNDKLLENTFYYDHFYRYYKNFLIENFNYILFDKIKILNFLDKYNYNYILNLQSFKNADDRLKSDLLRILILSIIGGYYLDLDIIINNYSKFISFIKDCYKYDNIIPLSKHIYFLKIKETTSFSSFIRNLYLQLIRLQRDNEIIRKMWLFKFFNELTFMNDEIIFRILKHESVTG